MATATLPFTHEMVVVHKLFRREFVQGPSWVRRVAVGDIAQAQIVNDHMRRIFGVLHHHHESEDLNLWPMLRERAVDEQQLLDTMESQHRAIDPALADAEKLGAAWAASGDAEAREAFAQAIEDFAAPLIAHLDQEESEILPLAQQHLTEEEWGLLAKHVMLTTPKADLIKGLGGIMEDASPEERVMMFTSIPTVPKLLYRAFGRRAYIKEVTGGPGNGARRALTVGASWIGPRAGATSDPPTRGCLLGLAGRRWEDARSRRIA